MTIVQLDSPDPTPAPYDDPSVIYSPAWWIKRLTKAMDARENELLKYEAYYVGDHPLTFATEKFRQRFGNLFSAFADNWCGLVVDAVEERLNVEGFRLPTDPTDVQEGTGDIGITADLAAWDLWQAANLDAKSQVAHTEALVNKEVHVLVWTGDDGDLDITIEHPRQMYVESEPGDPTCQRAAVKRWLDDTGYVFLTLYLPDAIFKFRSDRKAYLADGQPTLAREAKWVPREVPDEEWPLGNALGVVPVVPLRNRPRLLVPGVSEIKDVIPIQNAINKLCADLVIASEYQSFRQRFITGIELPRDPTTNEPVMPFKQLLEKVWLLEGNRTGSNPQVGELGQVDLTGYVRAIELFVQHVASQSRTPPHYFYLSGQFPSGEALTSAETGLVAKTRRKMRPFGEAWEAVIRLAFALQGEAERAKVTNSETVWANPESRNEAQVADAAIKLQTIGLPQEALWEYAGFTPQQIQRFKAMRKEEMATNKAAGSSGNVPVVIDPVTGQAVELKDPNLRHEAPPGQVETPAPVGAGASARP